MTLELLWPCPSLRHTAYYRYTQPQHVCTMCMLQSRQSIVRELEDMCEAGPRKNRAVVGVVYVSFLVLFVRVHVRVRVRHERAFARLCRRACRACVCACMPCERAQIHNAHAYFGGGRRNLPLLSLFRVFVGTERCVATCVHACACRFSYCCSALLIQAVQSSRRFNLTLQRYDRYLNNGKSGTAVSPMNIVPTKKTKKVRSFVRT